MWGKILNFDNLSCAISTEGVTFTTKPKTLSAPIFSSSGISYLFLNFCSSCHYFLYSYPALSPKTPKKVGSRSMTVMLSPAPVRRSDNYITSRSFEQRGQIFLFCFYSPFSLAYYLAPIYDGRSVKGAREFSFSDADFSKLNTWPLYEQGTQDLPFDAVVSVGYTLNTFGEGPRGGPNGLSTNVQFVILLALPDEDGVQVGAD
jgi:hypothetical protein